MKILSLLAAAFTLRRKTTDKARPDASRPLTFGRRIAGITVTEDNALNFSAVYAAVRLISETIAALPWRVHKTGATPGSSVPAPDHPVDRLINTQPNPEMDSLVFRETLEAHALMWGNGYAEIERDNAGRPIALWPIEPHRVVPVRSQEGELAYSVLNNSRGQTLLAPKNIFHVRGLGYDGMQGYSVIALARDTIGLGIAAERYGGAFFGNGSQPGGVLEHPNKIDDPKALRESWEEFHRGPDRGSRIAVLEEGMKFHQISIAPNDAQFLETRKFQIQEIARWFRVPPHKLADLERATFSNIEEQNINFVTDSIVPWARRWELEANRKLLGNSTKHFTKHNINALLRGNVKARNESYAIGRQWGWLSANDIRELEDLKPLPDKQGDIYLMPSNMIPAEKALEDPKPPPAPPGPPPSDGGGQLDQGDAAPAAGDQGQDANSTRHKLAHVRLFTEAANRCTGRWIDRVRQAYKRNPDDYATATRSIDEIGHYITSQFDSLVTAYLDTAGPGIPAAAAAAISDGMAQRGAAIQKQWLSEIREAYDTRSVDELIKLWETDLRDSLAGSMINHAATLSKNLINGDRS